MSFRKLQIFLFLFLVLVYTGGLLLSFALFSWGEESAALYEFEALCTKRDHYLARVDSLGTENTSQSRLRIIQQSLSPFLEEAETMLALPGWAEQISKSPLPFENSSSLLLVRGHRKLSYRGYEFTGELGKNWIRMFSLGVRHGDLYFHKFSTPLYSYPLDREEFLRTRGNVEILSNSGISFLKYFQSYGDRKLLLLVNLNELSKKELKKAILSRLAGTLEGCIPGKNDSFVWNSKESKFSDRLYGLHYQATAGELRTYLGELSWLHLIFTGFLIILYLSGGAALFKFRIEARYLGISLLFLVASIFLCRTYVSIGELSSSQNELVERNLQKDQIIEESQDFLQELRKRIEEQTIEWVQEARKPEFPFRTKAGLILLNRESVVEEFYEGLGSLESQIFAALMRDVHAGWTSQDIASVGLNLSPAKLPWTLRSLVSGGSLRRNASRILKGEPDKLRISIKEFMTVAGPLNLFIKKIKYQQTDLLLGVCIPKRFLGPILSEIEAGEAAETLLSTRSKAGMLIFDTQSSTTLFSHNWEKVPRGIFKDLIRAETRWLSNKDFHPSASMDWQTEASPSEISSQIQILLAWQKNLPGESKGGLNPWQASLYLLLSGFLLFLISRTLFRPLGIATASLQRLIRGQKVPEINPSGQTEGSRMLRTLEVFVGSLPGRALPVPTYPVLLKLVNEKEDSSAEFSRHLKVPIMEIRMELRVQNESAALHSMSSLLTLNSQLTELVMKFGGLRIQRGLSSNWILFPEENQNQAGQYALEVGLRLLRYSLEKGGPQDWIIRPILTEGPADLQFFHGMNFSHIDLVGEFIQELTEIRRNYIPGKQGGVLITKELESLFKFSYDLNPIGDEEQVYEIHPTPS